MLGEVPGRMRGAVQSGVDTVSGVMGYHSSHDGKEGEHYHHDSIGEEEKTTDRGD